MTEPVNHTTPHSSSNRGFRKATALLAATVVVGLISQNLYDWFAQGSPTNWLGVLGTVLVIAGGLVFFYKSLIRIIDTPYFAISSLLFIAVGTALGTFVTQNTPADVFVQRYGETGSKVLTFLQLDDVFHSWWYVGFFMLLAASLLKISARRKFSRENLGFHLAHLGPIIILTAFWIDYFYGFRGIIQLETGESTNVVKVYRGSTGYIAGETQLDFRIQLDSFEFEKHDPDYRIQVWRNPVAEHPQTIAESPAPVEPNPEIVASFPLKQGKVRRIYGTDVYFRLQEFYPNFHFEYTYPEVTDTIEARAPGILLDLKTPLGEAELILRSDQPGRNKISDPNHIGATIEFYWDLPEDVAGNLQKDPLDAQWAEMNRIIIAGAERTIYYVTARELSSEPLETQKFYLFPAREESGFTARFLIPDAAYLNAVPASKGEELLNPVAKVEVWDNAWSSSQDAYIYPSSGRRGGIFMIPGTSYFLALESFKDRETKYWKSDLSVLDANGEVQKMQSVKVNKPMLYSGYRFYQTDYDPNNPNYSGIGVSHEPGLYILYFGFAVLTLGCTLMFYGKYRKKGAMV